MHVRHLALLALAAIACGDDPPPKEEPPPPAEPGPPEFPGIVETSYQDSNLVVRFPRATDDYTPAEELRYELQVWENHPSRSPGAQPRSRTDVTPQTDCDPCSYRHSLPASGNVVWWFAVEVTDRDSVHGPGGGEGGASTAEDHAAGGDVLWPGAARIEPPALDPELWAQPRTVSPGAELRIVGSAFLDEPTRDDALSIGGAAVSHDAIQWSDKLLVVTVPETAVTGPIAVTTPWGTVESPGALEVGP